MRDVLGLVGVCVICTEVWPQPLRVSPQYTVLVGEFAIRNIDLAITIAIRNVDLVNVCITHA